MFFPVMGARVLIRGWRISSSTSVRCFLIVSTRLSARREGGKARQEGPHRDRVGDKAAAVKPCER